jgi:ectoine hydroxylase-related dioxygenase (phytanoyl-CoA dioxygenase family)
VAIHTGRTVHGNGGNLTGHARHAVHITYCTDCLRQKENQFLTVPLEIARRLDPELQAIRWFAVGGFAPGDTRSFEDPV